MAVYLEQNNVKEQQIYIETSYLLFWLRKQENKLAAGYAIFPEILGDFPQSLQSQEVVEHNTAKQDHLSDKPWSGSRGDMKNLNTIKRYTVSFLQSTQHTSPRPQGSITESHSVFDMKFYMTYIHQ